MLKVLRALSDSPATLALVAVNIAVYLAGVACPPAMDSVTNMAEPWRIVTYMFSHPVPVHLIINMTLLLAAGSYYERHTSAAKFLLTYLAGGILGALLFGAVSSLADSGSLSLTGSSAGVIAVLCAACLTRKDLSGFWGISPLFPVVLIILHSVTGLFGPNPGGNLAHIGGILAGMIARIPQRKQKTIQNATNHLIDKAHNSGYAALSREEKSLLFNNNSDKR